MGAAKGRARQERGLVNMDDTRASEDFLSQFPPDELTDERLDVDISPDACFYQKMVFHKNRLVWFSIVARTKDDNGDWHTMVRADSCHNEAHLHYFDRAGGETNRAVICATDTVEDVERGFDAACDRITDPNAWEENVRRWKAT